MASRACPHSCAAAAWPRCANVEAATSPTPTCATRIPLSWRCHSRVSPSWCPSEIDYLDQEPEQAAYVSRILVQGDLLRMDYGHDAEDFILYDRHAGMVWLVAHGERDHTVPQSASFELAGSLASATVERLWLPRSGHLIAVDVEPRNSLARSTI